MGSSSSSVVPISAAQVPGNINQFISSFTEDFLGQVRLLGADILDVDASNIILLKKNRKLSYKFWNGEDVFIGSIAMWDTKIQVFTFCVHLFKNYKFLIVNLPMQVHQNLIEYIENERRPIKRNELLEKIVFFYSNQNVYKNLIPNKSSPVKSNEVPQNTIAKIKKNSIPKKPRKQKKIQIPRMVINAPLSITESEKPGYSSQSSSQKMQTISIGIKSPKRRRSTKNSSNPNSSNSKMNSSESAQNRTSPNNIRKRQSNSVLESDFHMYSTDDKINTPEIYKTNNNNQYEEYYEEEEEEPDYTNEDISSNSKNRSNKSNSVKSRNVQNIQKVPPPPGSHNKYTKDFEPSNHDKINNNSFTDTTSATFTDQTASNRYSYNNNNSGISSANNNSYSNHSPNRNNTNYKKGRSNSVNNNNKVKSKEVPLKNTHSNHDDHNNHQHHSNKRRRSSQNDSGYYHGNEPNEDDNHYKGHRKNNIPNNTDHHHRRHQSANNATNPTHYYNSNDKAPNGSSRNRSTSSSGKRKIRIKKFPIQKVPTSYQNRAHSQPRASLKRIKYAKDANEFASNIAFFSSEEEDKKISQKANEKRQMEDFYRKIGNNLKIDTLVKDEIESSGSLSFFDLTNRQIKKFKQNSDDEIDVQHVFQDYSSSIDFNRKSEKPIQKVIPEKIKNDESDTNRDLSVSSYIKALTQPRNVDHKDLSSSSNSSKKRRKNNSSKINNKSRSRKSNNDSISSSFFSDFKVDAKRTEEEKNKIWKSINLDNKQSSSSKFTKPRKETDLIDDENPPSSASTLSNHRSNNQSNHQSNNQSNHQSNNQLNSQSNNQSNHQSNSQSNSQSNYQSNSSSKRKNRADSVRSDSSSKRNTKKSTTNINKREQKDENEIKPRKVVNKKGSRPRAESVHSHHSYRQKENEMPNLILNNNVKSSNSNSDNNKDNNKRRRRKNSNLSSDNSIEKNSSIRPRSATASKKFYEKHCEYSISPNLDDETNLLNSKKNHIMVDVKYHKEISYLDE